MSQTEDFYLSECLSAFVIYSVITLIWPCLVIKDFRNYNLCIMLIIPHYLVLCLVEYENAKFLHDQYTVDPCQMLDLHIEGG